MHKCIFTYNIQLKLQLNSNGLMFYHLNNSHLINVVIFFFTSRNGSALGQTHRLWGVLDPSVNFYWLRRSQSITELLLRAFWTPVRSFILEEKRKRGQLLKVLVACEILCQEGLDSPARMYTTGLNPFYASNFSLWTAYCSGGFGVDSMKKPSFCIADILHVGDAENIPGSSSLMAHIGARASGSPLRPSPVTPDARLHPASAYHRHGIHLTSASRGAMHAQSAPPPSSKDLKFGIDRILSTDFEPKAKESPSLRGKTVNRSSCITSHLTYDKTIRLI